MPTTSKKSVAPAARFELSGVLPVDLASPAGLSAVMVGGLAGWLAYYIFKGLFLVLAARELTALAVLLALAVLVVTARLVIRDAPVTPTVWARGGLIGAAEWLLGAIVLTVYAHRPIPAELSQEVTQSGALMGPGLVVMLSWLAAIAMIALCLTLNRLMTRLAAKSPHVREGEAPLW